MPLIICEPSASNVAVNALLKSHGLQPVATYRKAPQGICREMDVCRYEIRRSGEHAVVDTSLAESRTRLPAEPYGLRSRLTALDS